MDYWVDEWAEGGVIFDELDWKETEAIGNTVPCLVYAREASKSPGMKNRQRVWEIGLQLEGMIRELQDPREAAPHKFLPTYDIWHALSLSFSFQGIQGSVTIQSGLPCISPYADFTETWSVTSVGHEKSHRPLLVSGRACHETRRVVSTIKSEFREAAVYF